jgi:hypothetical protein
MDALGVQPSDLKRRSNVGCVQHTIKEVKGTMFLRALLEICRNLEA